MIRQSNKFLVLFKILLILAASSTSFAQQARADESCDCNRDHDHGRFGLGLSVSPQYYVLNRSGYSSAFTSNGFQNPKSGVVGLDLLLYGTTATNWQIGLGLDSVGYSNDIGSNTAEYNQEAYGLWVAKVVNLPDSLDLSVGALFAYGHARLEVLSTSASGRTDEGSFLLEPKITLAYKIASWLRIGISGSYNEPLAESNSTKGTGLTTGNISIHGPKAGVEFILGRFGAGSAKDSESAHSY